VLVAYYTDGRLSLPAFLVLIVAMLSLLLSPALVERKLRRGRQQLVAQYAVLLGGKALSIYP